MLCNSIYNSHIFSTKKNVRGLLEYNQQKNQLKRKHMAGTEKYLIPPYLSFVSISNSSENTIFIS